MQLGPIAEGNETQGGDWKGTPCLEDEKPIVMGPAATLNGAAGLFSFCKLPHIQATIRDPASLVCSLRENRGRHGTHISQLTSLGLSKPQFPHL